MQQIGILIGVVLSLIAGIYASLGFELRTKRGWLIVLDGFIGGFLIGFSAGKTITNGLGMGIFMTLLTMWSGFWMLQHKRRFGK